MFNSLANYLLGTITNTHNETAAGVVEETNVRLSTAAAAEDDWVLVSHDSEGNSELSSDDEDFDIEIAGNITPLITRSSSTSSLPCTTMEESWFVTPPPCFTSAGPIHMETSPLENLLIEHPSMSVYQHSQHYAMLLINRRRNSIPIQSTPDEEVKQLLVELVTPIIEEDFRRDAMLSQPPPRNNHSILQRQEKQIIKNKQQAQKVQIRRAHQYLKGAHLERNNKAREVNTRNRRMRRGERSQGATRSYANNNRKC